MTINNINNEPPFKTVLKQWEEEPEVNQEENRVEAKNRLFHFFNRANADVLDLGDLHLSSLPDIFNDPCFGRLKNLSLINNQLEDLPDTFDCLKQVTYLRLNHNKIRELPKTISNLSMLTRLDLDNNQIKVLPNKVFANLKSLKHLNLNDNQLEHLPVLGCLSLESLRLIRNKLETLPYALGSLQSLKELHLSYNRLKDFPDTYMLALKTLDLSHNTTLSVNKILMQILDLSLNGCEVNLEDCCDYPQQDMRDIILRGMQQSSPRGR